MMSATIIYFSLVYLFLTICSCMDISEQLAKQQVQSYQPCRTDGDCKMNSFCYGNDDNKTGYCKCQDGFELFRNISFYECFAAVKLEEPCQNDFECKTSAGPLAICNGSKLCECNRQTAHSYNGKCYRDRKLTESCIDDHDCQLLDRSFAFCVAGHCQCNIGLKPDANKTSCVFGKNLGEKCSDDKECGSIGNARCYHDKCECRMDYVVSRDGMNCLRAALRPADSCVEDLQCLHSLENVKCTLSNETYGECTCLEKFHSYDQKCIKTATAGDPCSEDANCIFDKKLKDSVQCKDGHCLCKFGQSDDDSGCNLSDNSSTTFRSSLMFITISIFSIIIFI